MWTYILGPILAFLPRRWRKEHLSRLPIRWGPAGFFSGLLEIGGFFPLLIWWYSFFVTAFEQALAQNPAAGQIPDGREGLVGIAGFAMNPLTWVVCYVGLEGLVRTAGSMAGGEASGTIFLAGPYFLYKKIAKRTAAPELPLVRDEITPGDGSTCDIRIASSRAREDWKYPFTIKYGGAYFQVVAMARLAAGPRPYMYSLRRLPAGEIAHGLKEYDPADGLVAAMEPLQRVEDSIPSLGLLSAVRATSHDVSWTQNLGAKYLLGPFVSLLPTRWREAVFHQAPSLLVPGAIISGGIGLVVAAIFFGGWFMGDLGVQWTRQQTFLFTVAIAYLGVEGLLRSYLAMTTGEVHGTVLLGVAEYFTSLITRPPKRVKLPLVADEIANGDGTCDMKISSCRERREWKFPYAIKYEGTFFQVIASQDVRNGPRPYVYSLRRLPAGEMAGGLKDYTTKDILLTGQIERVKW